MSKTKTDAFLEKVLRDLGGAFGIARVRMGNALGFYRTLHGSGPMTASELAAASGLAERQVREWLSYQAASGYVHYDPGAKTFSLLPEQAAVLADEHSAFYMIEAFDAAAAFFDNQARMLAAFMQGEDAVNASDAADRGGSHRRPA